MQSPYAHAGSTSWVPAYEATTLSGSWASTTSTRSRVAGARQVRELEVVRHVVLPVGPGKGNVGEPSGVSVRAVKLPGTVTSGAVGPFGFRVG